MKRILALSLSAALLLALLGACTGGDPETTVIPPESGGESATVPPEDTPSPSPEPSDEPSNGPGFGGVVVPGFGESADPSHHPEESHHADPTHHPEESHHVDPTHHPEPTSKPTAEPTSKPTAEPTAEPTATLPPAAGVDLHSFYRSILTGDESFNATEAVFGELLENFYPGLSAIALKQQEIYMPMMSAVVCEIAMAEVENASDVPAVQAIFQARINTQAGGGAWYPESVAGWQNNSRVVAHGNYVMMIAYKNCDAIVSQFNALF